MRAVYVTVDGASIRRNGERLQVFQRGQVMEDIRLQHLEQLVLMGNIIVTPSALDLLLEKGVDTVFLSHSGRYRGRLTSGVSRQIHLRLAQYQTLSDPAKKMALAKACVAGKLHNSRVLLQRFSRRHKDNGRIRRAVASLKAGMLHLNLAADLDAVRGVEGAGASAYFAVFGEMLRSSQFHFNGRNRRPPRDPVNAMLSFGYTLLHNMVQSLVEIVGLDPYLGALHEPQTGRPSLACDLVEEFRAPVVDAMVLSLINRKVVRIDDFEELGEGEPVRMKREVVSTLVRAFERRMQHKTIYEPRGDKLTYRDVMEQQIRAYARVLLGRAESYQAYLLR